MLSMHNLLRMYRPATQFTALVDLVDFLCSPLPHAAAGPRLHPLAPPYPHPPHPPGLQRCPPADELWGRRRPARPLCPVSVDPPLARPAGWRQHISTRGAQTSTCKGWFGWLPAALTRMRAVATFPSHTHLWLTGKLNNAPSHTLRRDKREKRHISEISNPTTVVPLICSSCCDQQK
jgi:hypothetical protein